MTIMVFDTFAAANRFKRAGFTEEQVEALVEITRETTSLPDNSALATKADLSQVESRLELKIAGLAGDIVSLESRLDAKITGLATEIVGLEVRLDAKIAASEAKLEAGIAVLRVEMATLGSRLAGSQVQVMAVTIASMALMVTLATVLPRLLR